METCTCTVDRAMFDTRKGVHIPRFPNTAVDDEAAAVRGDVVTGVLTAPYHTTDGGNAVLCCQAPDRSFVEGADRSGADAGTIDLTQSGPPDAFAFDSASGGFSASSSVGVRNSDPDDPAQVAVFAPRDYVKNGRYMGTHVIVTEDPSGGPSAGGRGVTISRTTCEATEGRRYWFDQFVNEQNPLDTLSTTYGLFTTTGLITNTAALKDRDSITAPDPIHFLEVHPGDGWTMLDVAQAEGTDYAGMTAPVCPYTIVLDTSPSEGRTVVVKVREDENLSVLRDHELYFYEEPTYRFDVLEPACLEIGGSSWVTEGCFINNVPCFDPATAATDFIAANRRIDGAGDPICNDGDIMLARGDTDLDVLFTDVDWNIPRRITAVALNDDVDEPTETRTIYHEVDSCVSINHNNLGPCYSDAGYQKGQPVNWRNGKKIDVTLIDDDIADLSILCMDGYDSSPPTIDETFIGSYDSSGPSGSGWYEALQRVGPNAEDGITNSQYGGSMSAVGGFIDPYSGYSYTGQTAADGIGGGGHASGATTNGYVTDMEDPVCSGDSPNQTVPRF